VSRDLRARVERLMVYAGVKGSRAASTQSRC
jgi:hypothetical protein